ncbi:MAG: hypothetical protein ABSB91_00710 [Sedimentisphaerales bacterium]
MKKHSHDILDEKQSIRLSIRRVAELLGKTPTGPEYKRHRRNEEFSLEQITYRYPWTEAVRDIAGLEPNPSNQPPHKPNITKQELIEEFIRVSNEVGKIPGKNLFRSKAKYSWRPYITNWTKWRKAVSQITEQYAHRFNFDVDYQRAKSTPKKPKRLDIDLPLKFVPSNEYETLVLFALLANELGFEILRVQSNFPDGILRKKGKEILVEFEFLSSNYLQHCHPLDFDGICICWRKDVDIGGIEILSLEDYIRGKSN